LNQRHPEDGQLRAPEPEWPHPLIIQLGDCAGGLADIEGNATRALLRQLAWCVASQVGDGPVIALAWSEAMKAAMFASSASVGSRHHPFGDVETTPR
jgi:hypothetical protein